MEIAVITKVIFSLVLVIFFMYLILRIIQNYTKFGTKPGNTLTSIKIENIAYIDENTKIVHISQKQISYILAINKNNIILIDKYEINPS